MRDFSGKTGKLHEDREGQIKICFAPLPTAHPCLVNEGNVNYLLPHGGAAPATGPGVQEGKTEENSQDNPPLAQLIPALLPTTLCSREGAKNPSQSQFQSLLGFMELQEDLK